MTDSYVLAVDAGTTSMKAAVVKNGAEVLAQASVSYPLNIDGDAIDIDPMHWWNGLLACCRELGGAKKQVQAISFSVSTPGAMAFDENGVPLTPAVLFMDGRGREQAQRIRDVIGEERLLRETSNLPVSGGCTASTILWWKDHQPGVFTRAAFFGHTNTFLVHKLTGAWGMDPSTASLTALYNTTRNDGRWNEPICGELGVQSDRLPPIIDSWRPVGALLGEPARETGLPEGVPVLMGGNDAMCAALTGGVTREGAVMNVCGTCEILCVGLSRSIPGSEYNVRCHVIPNLWSTLYVLNTGGKALEWFHQNFRRDLTRDAFFQNCLPRVIHDYFDSGASWTLPEYEVFLAGDRYSTEPRRAAFTGLRLETTADAMLLAMIRGNNRYMARHLGVMRERVKLSPRVHLTGGGLPPALIRCKKEWMGDFDYVLRENSSMLGAAQLAHYAVTGEAVWDE